jgi:hypothetical protein
VRGINVIIYHPGGGLKTMQAVRTTKKRNDRAVSEAIGFILIFGIIISGIGLVTLYGYPMLLQQQTNADEQIMEKNLIVLQNDVKSLAYKTVPYKETSLKIGGGAMVVHNTTEGSDNAHFEISDTNGLIKNDDGSIYTFYPGALRYESTSAQTGMSLENGAVVKRMLAQEGSTMLAEPRWFVDDQTNTAVIYLIGFNSTDAMSRAGIGTVKMALDQTQTSSTPYDIPISDRIQVKYIPNSDANYATAWDNYFENTLKMTGDPVTGYTIPTDPAKPAKLVITRYDIIIKSV